MMVKREIIDWQCIFEIDLERTKKEKKIIINCYEPDGIYYGVSEFDDDTLRTFSHPVESFLWELQTMADHVRWKSEQLRAKEELDGEVNVEEESEDS